MESKQKLDHREIAKSLGLYYLDKGSGQGLPLLLPNFTFIRNKIQDLIRKKWQEFGFEEVITPILGSSLLYETSGHLNHYKEYMFPEICKNQESYYLRPMTCPHHCLIFQQKPRSYRELPLRLSENSILFRYEPSGSLKGLERTRYFELADHHTFVTVNDLKGELKNNFLFVKEILENLEIEIKRIVCSLHDGQDKKKYHDDLVLWEKSEALLIDSLKEMKTDYEIQVGEAAFYGPKIDFEVQARDEKYITISTIQLDFLLPEKFKLKFLDEKQQLQRPIIIHQSPIGSYQRFIALLVEQKEGKIPFWLVPLQIVILSVSEKEEINKYCQKVARLLEENDIRVEIWNKKTLNFRIKEIYEKKVPFYLFIGSKELEEQELILFNTYNNDQNAINKDTFQQDVKRIILKGK